MPGVVNWVKSIWQHFLGCCSLFPDHQHGRVSALDFGSLSSSDSALTTRTAVLTACFISLRCMLHPSLLLTSSQSVIPRSPLSLCSVCIQPGIFLYCSPSFLFEPESLTNTELSDWPGWPVSPRDRPVFFHPHLTSEVLMCTERPLLAEPSP